MENNEVMILSDKKFETCSKAFNKELNAILDAQRKGLKAGESIAQHLLNIRTAELWKTKDGEPIIVDGVECNTFGDVATLFGMGRQQAYKLASAYNLKYNEETLVERLATFTLGQITEMLRLSVSDIMLLIDEGKLTNKLSLKGIRAVVDEYKKAEEPEADESASSNVEVGDELPETEEETDNTVHVYLGKNELVLTDKDYADFMKWLTKRSYL